MTMKRRALVLSDESARHPFLRTLPPHVRRPDGNGRDWRKRMGLTPSDWRSFFTAYCATFVIVSVFIA
jgi:hypothetical protein